MEWLICPKCGKEWNDLMPDGICFECYFAEKRQVELAKLEKEKQEETLKKGKNREIKRADWDEVE
jgi:hypothetical protein